MEICVHTHTYTYIYIERERERERGREREREGERGRLDDRLMGLLISSHKPPMERPHRGGRQRRPGSRRVTAVAPYPDYGKDLKGRDPLLWGLGAILLKGTFKELYNKGIYFFRFLRWSGFKWPGSSGHREVRVQGRALPV